VSGGPGGLKERSGSPPEGQGLEGRTALVTGASGAIGRACAVALAGQGARVVVAYGSDQQGAEETADLVKAAGGEPVVARADLTDPDAAKALVAAAGDAGVDILVNNAGMTRDGLVLRMRDDDFTGVLEVNLVAAFRCTREALRGMLRRRWGRVVSISSVVGLVGNPGQANYAASKAGLIGLTMSVAREVAGRGITVNAVAPGYIPSKLTDAMSEARSRSGGSAPRRRWRRRSASWPARRPATSPARSWPWTAA
jgi:3-oxoacyl-[acyl-carrier protein] reductase